MLKILKTFVILIFFLLPIFSLQAKSETNLYLFYGEGCPHCAKENAFLEKLEKEGWLKENNVKINRYEVWHNADNGNLLGDLAKRMNWKVQGIPFTIIGEKTINGYFSDEITGEQIKNAVMQCSAVDCPDVVQNYLSSEKSEPVEGKFEKISLPWIGQIDLKNFSLPLLTIIIAGLDGFNPCALWVLLFLLSLLIGLQDKKRLIILGAAFIITSAVFYFLVLAAWFNVLQFIKWVSTIRIILAIIALYAGYQNLKQYWRKESDCEVIDESKRKELFSRAREIISRKKIYLALSGIILLALSVNLFELVCSAGLPAVYTQVLALSNLSAWQYYAYLALYSFIFVLNQIIIFLMAVATFKMKVINPQVVRWMGLIGGAVMLLIGILLLVNPSLLMFG